MSNEPVGWWRRIGRGIGWRIGLPLVAALDRAWPRECFVCGGTSRSDAVCAPCLAELPWHRGPHCPVCALPTALGETCGRCLRRPPHFDATQALFRYETPLREMVLALKHGRGLALATFFAERLLPLVECEVDLVLPVPLHAARLRERGYNQCVELALPLARALGRPIERTCVLRDVDTPHQAGARRAVRRRNVRGAFRCTRQFDGLHVLVLDDVMTSGATLDELARTLKLAGAATVTNVVLARTLNTKA